MHLVFYLVHYSCMTGFSYPHSYQCFRALEGGEGKESAHKETCPRLHQSGKSKAACMRMLVVMSTRCLATCTEVCPAAFSLPQFPSLAKLDVSKACVQNCFCRLRSPRQGLIGSAWGCRRTMQGDMCQVSALRIVAVAALFRRRHWPRTGCPSRQSSDLLPPRRPLQTAASLRLPGFW